MKSYKSLNLSEKNLIYFMLLLLITISLFTGSILGKTSPLILQISYIAFIPLSFATTLSIILNSDKIFNRKPLEEITISTVKLYIELSSFRKVGHINKIHVEQVKRELIKFMKYYISKKHQ